jgi:uncharacterized protein YkvS
MKVYLAIKNGAVIHHTDLTAMEQLNGITTPEKTVTIQEWEAAGSKAYIDALGKIVLGEPAELVSRREEIEALTNEEAELQAELDSKDYKVIKAAEIGDVLAETDPALHQRRDWCRNRINEVRDRLAVLNTEAA